MSEKIGYAAAIEARQTDKKGLSESRDLAGGLLWWQICCYEASRSIEYATPEVQIGNSRQQRFSRPLGLGGFPPARKFTRSDPRLAVLRVYFKISQGEA